MFVTVITRDLANPDNPPDRTRINYASVRARAWLTKHWHWALCNNRSITTAPEQADDAA